MDLKNSTDKPRLHVVDSLRGFAIVAIMLLHNLEHFDFYFIPEFLPSWLKTIDKALWDFMFFMFAGKTYSMFALLFGLTFYIQSKNQKEKGKSFKFRFAWRMVLLFVFGLVNSAFYQGDILTIYAGLAILLIPLENVSNRVLLAISCFLLFQPLEVYHLFEAIRNPVQDLSDPGSWSYFGQMVKYIPKGTFFETVRGNLTNGKKAVLLWNLENGRYFLILSLFILGIWIGRKNIFSWDKFGAEFWGKVLIYSSLIFVPLFFIQKNLEIWIDFENILRPTQIMISSWSNTSLMFVLISVFVLLFNHPGFHRRLNYFNAFGKMSLSNYIIQSVLGTTIYYGFGLGLYKYTGATFSAAIAVLLTILIGYFCKWWLTKNKRGPLETIWHNLTWLNN